MKSENFKQWRKPTELPDANLFKTGTIVEIEVESHLGEIVYCFWDKKTNQLYDYGGDFSSKQYLNWGGVKRWKYVFSPDEEPPVSNCVFLWLLVLSAFAITLYLAAFLLKLI